MLGFVKIIKGRVEEFWKVYGINDFLKFYYPSILFYINLIKNLQVIVLHDFILCYFFAWVKRINM